MSKYVSLHNHTSFSIGQALTSPQELFDKTKELGQKAVAVVDTDTMAAMWDCLKVSKETGVKLIAGCEFNFVEDLKAVDDTRLTKIVLLAKNHTGYKNMLALRKHGFDNMSIHFKKAHSRIDWKLLEKYSEGLICLTGDGNGYIPQLIMYDKLDKAKSEIAKFVKLFDQDFALELQPHNLQIRSNPYSGDIDQRKINIALKRFHEEMGTQCIVATGSYYLERDHHEAQDVLLAISSGQPVFSGQRLKFDKKDFYVKSEEQVRAYFGRHKNTWPQEFVDSMIELTSVLADRCEVPEFIDPKFSNPSGKELPEFPVRDQDDYQDFLKWKRDATSVFFDKSLPDDALYYRFSSEVGLYEKINSGQIPKEDIDTCIEQMKEEFDVFEYRGFSSYMSIVAAFIKWCKKNDIPVGPGRGCTTSDTLVLTDNGYENINKIPGGTIVKTHKGRGRGVVCRFSNGIRSDLVSIKSERSVNVQTFTKDHKLLCFESGKKIWKESGNIKKGDLLFHAWPMRSVKKQENIDLVDFLPNCSKYDYTDSKIIIHDTNVIHSLSCRNISRELGISYGSVYSLKKGGGTKYLSEIKKYLLDHGISVDEWVKLRNTYTISRYIEWNEDFCYLLGRWIGDGSFHGKNNGITIAFNSNDIEGISKTRDILGSIFGKVYINNNHGGSGVALTVSSRICYALFKNLFPNYKDSSSKCFTSNFRELDDSLLKSMVSGYFEADGHSKKYLFSFKTTSRELALQTREALLYLKICSSLHTESCPKRYGVVCKKSYNTTGPIAMLNGNFAKQVVKDGFLCRVIDVKDSEPSEVFDVKIKDDSSYISGNYIAHNSVGGSLTAYLNGIHEAYPKKYDLIFARFLNKFKDAYPDCDIDFSPVGRSRLHNHLRKVYGEENVAHVSNVNTITPKVYARDIARVFEFGDDGRSAAAEIGDDIADSISSEYSRVTTALKQAPLFMEYAKQYPELAEYSILGGKARAWSTHAAGLIISKRALHTIVPVRRDSNGAYCLEYEKGRAEDNGLVKMDTLGLETLDIIKRTYSIIKDVGKIPPSLPFNYEQYDEKTYDLISKGDTFCVFQLTGVAAPVCKMLQPKSIEDIALVTALIRPAAKDIIPEFMKVRNGEKKMQLMHPALKRAFEKTYGFGLFEEALLYIAQDIAGWDLHSADRLRKLTKEKGKNPEKAQKWKDEFIEDSINNGFDKDIATSIWENVIEKFQGYGFNKSHAVLYSMISFHTAYLKANFPLEFLVSNLMAKVNSSNPKAKDEVIRIKQEIRALGVKIVPPDINTSDVSYKIIDDNTLMTGLDSLRNVKEGAIDEIKAKRPFTSLRDLIERTDTQMVRAPVIQSLAASGALDRFKMRREHMFYYCSDVRNKLRALRSSLEKRVAKKTITSEEAELEYKNFEYPFPETEVSWKPFEVFALEAKYMGEGITGTVEERFPRFFDRDVTNIVKLSEKIEYTEFSDDEKENKRANTHNVENHGVLGIKGIITSVFEFKVKKEESKIFGQVMAILEIEDPFGNPLKVIAFPDSWQRAKDRIEKELSGGKSEIVPGIAVYISGFFQWENSHAYSLILGDILSYKEAPKPPKSLASKKVKIPRKTKVKKEDVAKMSKRDLAEALEDDLVFDGVSPLDSDDDYDFR